MMKNVFIAEDDEQMRKLYFQAFNYAGFEVEMASDGEETLKKLLEIKVKPNIIFLDIMMPKKNGFEVMEILFNDVAYEKNKDVPVVVLTNFESLDGGEADLEKARSLGAIDVIIKSKTDPTDIIKKAEEIINRK